MNMRRKLGLEQERADDTLVSDLLSLMAAGRTDYTTLFRSLSEFSSSDAGRNEVIRDQFLDREGFDRWADRYRTRLREEASRDDERRRRMQGVNPKYVLRNYLAQVAIEKAQQKDYAEIDRLLTILHDPFNDHPGMESYALPPPHWGKHLVVSCSS
jgi:uncharacterized protein YdiU (UPF0061 family)